MISCYKTGHTTQYCDMTCTNVSRGVWSSGMGSVGDLDVVYRKHAQPRGVTLHIPMLPREKSVMNN